ncbi:MAG: CBS domain-containing protein [Ileibacterium sp.]|nr:CBS domain-containing protein [Ileibacterium sp.]
MEYDFAALWPLVFLIFALAAAFGSSSILQSHDSRVLQGYRLGMLICVAAASFAAAGLCSRWSGLSPLICMVILLILFQMACFCLEYVSWRHPAKPFQSFTRAFASFFAFFISWIPQIPMEQDPLEEWKQVEELEEDEQEVLRNALEFADTSIDEMMTHRSAVVSLSLRDDPKDWKETIMANRHTFYPVTNENDDDIIGVLDTRDYFRLSDFSRRNILKKTMEPAFFAAENTNAVDIVQAMKASKKYFAVVLDEYGGMSGIVTIHDILEELLGEMTETNERAESDIVRIGPDQWRIAGSSSLDEVSKAIGKTLQLDDYETFAGYIIGTIGRIPEDGSQFEVDIEDLHIVVRSVQNHRIVQTLVHRKSPAGVQK